MKTSSYTAKSQLHAAETSQQELRSIKRSGATLLLLFTALFALLFFSSCEDEDDKEEELRPDNLELIVGNQSRCGTRLRHRHQQSGPGH